MLYIDYVNEVLAALRETAMTDLSTDASTEAYKAQNSVKRAVRHIFNHQTWSFRRSISTFTTTSGTSEYALPKDVGLPYVLLFEDSSGYSELISVVGEKHFDEAIPDPTASGNPSLARLFEMAGVSIQPTSASTISAVSSDADDITQKVLVKGLVSNEIDYEQLSLNGTVAVNTTKSFSKLLAVTKSAVTEGRITLTSNSGGVTNLVLAPEQTTVRIRKIKLYPAPDSTLTITVKHFKNAPFLTHRYEDIEIPEQWGAVVTQFGIAFALMNKGKEQAAEAAQHLQTATGMLEEMRQTEDIASNEPLILKPFDWQGGSQWDDIPSGWGPVSY